MKFGTGIYQTHTTPWVIQFTDSQFKHKICSGSKTLLNFKILIQSESEGVELFAVRAGSK